VAPKLFVMLDAALASGCFMSNFDIWGGASNRAQQCNGVNFSRLVVSIGDTAPSDEEKDESRATAFLRPPAA
jgi:hypothetical protein